MVVHLELSLLSFATWHSHFWVDWHHTQGLKGSPTYLISTTDGVKDPPGLALAWGRSLTSELLVSEFHPLQEGQRA